jgi:cyclopropane fatty-acyl-phospholipid synthase-like methyltransferase
MSQILLWIRPLIVPIYMTTDMLKDKKRVLEIGCADAFASQIVRRDVGHLTGLDFDPVFLEDAASHLDPAWPIELVHHDMLEGPPPCEEPYDAIFSCDVFEHIAPENERVFMINALSVLKENGALIFGMPSLEAQAYAAPHNKTAHVNCKSGEAFREFMCEYFDNVFLFSMNDEVVHTGFSPMAHYLFVLCCGRKP